MLLLKIVYKESSGTALREHVMTTTTAERDFFALQANEPIQVLVLFSFLHLAIPLKILVYIKFLSLFVYPIDHI